MGYRLNRLDEPVFMVVPKPMLTEFGIHHRLESCVSQRKTIIFKVILSLPDVVEVEFCCRRFPPLWTTSSSRFVLAIEQRTFITTLLPGTAGSGVCPGAWLPLASVIFVTKSIIRAISTLKEVKKKQVKPGFTKHTKRHNK